MAVSTGTAVMVFVLMSLLHAGLSFRPTLSNRRLDDEELGTIDYIRFRDGVMRDRYVLSRVLQAVAEIQGFQAMVKRAVNSRPLITTPYPFRLISRRNDDLRVDELTGTAGQRLERRSQREATTRTMLDGQIEWLISRVYPWRVNIDNDYNENYFGNHVDLIGSSILG